MEIEPGKRAQGGVPNPLHREERGRSGATLFSRLLSFVEGRHKGREPDGVLHGRPVTQVSQEELREGASRMLTSLDLEAKSLMLDGGHLGEAFVSRYVEPLLAPLRRVVSMAKTGMACSLTDVEMVSSVHKDQDLRSKICDRVVQQTRQAIAEDMAFILSFPSEVLDEVHAKVQSRAVALRTIQAQLEPILQEMRELIPNNFSANSLLDLYQWRTKIDQSRQRLQDTALSLIEDSVRLLKRSEALGETVSSTNELVDIAKIFKKISAGEFEWPKSLFELEEASYLLTRLVERQKELGRDREVVQLVRELREDIDVLFEAANRSQYHDILLRVMEHLRTVEDTMAEESSDEEIQPPELFP